MPAYSGPGTSHGLIKLGTKHSHVQTHVKALVKASVGKSLFKKPSWDPMTNQSASKEKITVYSSEREGRVEG